MIQTRLEAISRDLDSSMSLMVNPKLNDFYFWHFHPEIELVFITAEKGIRHVGEHKSEFLESDLVLIGSNIPHLNFDYGIKTTYTKLVIHLQPDFPEFHLPEFAPVKELFHQSAFGISFGKEIIKRVNEKLWLLPDKEPITRMFLLLEILYELARCKEKELLHNKPVINPWVGKEQKRIKAIYAFIEANYQNKITIQEIAEVANLSNEAFCRYFKKISKLTFTEFLNHYRIDKAKGLMNSNLSINQIAYDCGYESPSYFHRTFKRITGFTPLGYTTK